MDLLILIIVLGLIFLSLNIKSGQNSSTVDQDNIVNKIEKENFANTYVNKPANFDNYKSPNMYQIPHTIDTKQILDNTDYNILPSNDNYDNNNWVINESGFTDIFNYADKGSDAVNGLHTYEESKKRSVQTKQVIKNNDDVVPLDKLIKKVDGNTTKVDTKQIIESKKLTDNTPKVSETMLINDTNYNLLGIASNEYYNQYYIVYEAESQEENDIIENERLTYLNYKIYTYILVQFDKGIPNVKYFFGPRTKINVNDVVTLCQGPIQLGPLRIIEFKN